MSIKVWKLDDNAGYVIRGTTDMAVVEDLLVEEDSIRDDAPEDYDWDIQFTVEQCGYLRMNPCTCGEHGWHIGTAKAPGRGVFQGVWASDIHYVELEYDCDE